MTCLVDTCKKRFLYVNIKNFAEHVIINHIKICELEDKKCSPSDHDANWIYFTHTQQGKIECVICRTTVTDESTNNHSQKHI